MVGLSKYSIAKEIIENGVQRATDAGVDVSDVHEATLVLLVQALKDARGGDNVRGLLQYELDNVGSGGFVEVARGGGHS